MDRVTRAPCAAEAVSESRFRDASAGHPDRQVVLSTSTLAALDEQDGDDEAVARADCRVGPEVEDDATQVGVARRPTTRCRLRRFLVGRRDDVNTNGRSLTAGPTLRVDPLAEPEFQHQQRPETRLMWKSLRLMLVDQSFDGSGIEEIALLRALRKERLARKVFQLGAKPMIERHAEAHLFSSPDPGRNRVGEGFAQDPFAAPQR